ncbi:MAG: winged helix-turn-helix domain-containing protein, partial [Pseudomonadota bacterium]
VQRPEQSFGDRSHLALNTLVMQSPQRYGYVRASWTSELLAQALNAHYRLVIHPSTVRGVLNREGFGWCRARPTLQIRASSDFHDRHRMDFTDTRAFVHLSWGFEASLPEHLTY